MCQQRLKMNDYISLSAQVECLKKESLWCDTLEVQIQRQWNVNRQTAFFALHTFIEAIQAPEHFNLRPEWVLKKRRHACVCNVHKACIARCVLGGLKKPLSENKISAAKKVCCCLSVVKNQQLKVSKESGRSHTAQTPVRERYTENEWWWWKRVVRCPAMNIYWPLHHEYVDFLLPQQSSAASMSASTLKVEKFK